jgi:hypothetical protein
VTERIELHGTRSPLAATILGWWWRRRGYRVATFEAKVTRADGRVEIYRQVSKLPRVTASGG